jgi:uncharacterized circularly permuted ATP-grasp superfamily protein/uncharacterized alpha-E superfamily protein
MAQGSDKGAERRRGAGLGALLSSYAVPEGHFDELLDGDGERTPRPWWDAFASQAEDLSAPHLVHAQARVDRQIRENGVTYNVYAAADGPTRPWTLDVLPLIIPAREWDPLALGLRQRARLLNALAADLYGPQRVLQEGLLPPALLFRHPGFLRSCHGVRPPGQVFLHLVAFDLGRGPDGAWRVVGTRTQSPSGAGYALENRATIPRLFPAAFRELGVHVLAPFFRTLQDTLIAGAPSGGATPHIVLLTPGPYNETFFEHAYLARRLGFPLVEGGDLTVRHDRVFLKTVAGLQPVHAILRRLDDDYCDPLELRPDSALGVPGLVQSWRAGHVLVANAFGTSVLESPALLWLLPALCERLMGEPLETRSLSTRWGPDAAGALGAQPGPATAVVKSAFADGSMEPVFLADLDAAGRAAWEARLADAPERFVVEEYLPLSHAPVWHAGRLESRALMLRVFLVADGQGDYHVMPGGLSRIAGADRQIVSGQRGGGSKDTWVLSGTPHEPARALVRPHEGGLPHGERMTSSRAAEHLFWLGRYAERSENCGRLLRAVLSRLPDIDAFPGGLPRIFVETCRTQGLLDRAEWEALAAPAGPDPTPAFERILLDGVLDRQRPQTLAFDIDQTVRVAGSVRERLSSDNWRLLNQLFALLPRRPKGANTLDETLELIDACIVSLVAVAGLEMAHMTRDDGWRFLSLGRHLERLLFVSTTVTEMAGGEAADDPALLEWLLELSDSIITYRARFVRPPEWPLVAELLLFDARNPRSARFQLDKLAKHVRLLPDADLADLAADLDRAGEGLSPSGLHADDPGGRRRLVEHLRAAVAVGHRVSDSLTLRYFSHVAERPHTTVTS